MKKKNFHPQFSPLQMVKFQKPICVQESYGVDTNITATAESFLMKFF
jgi:hypothetical protein